MRRCSVSPRYRQQELFESTSLEASPETTPHLLHFCKVRTSGEAHFNMALHIIENVTLRSTKLMQTWRSRTRQLEVV